MDRDEEQCNEDLPPVMVSFDRVMSWFGGGGARRRCQRGGLLILFLAMPRTCATDELCMKDMAPIYRYPSNWRVIMSLARVGSVWAESRLSVGQYL